MHIINSKIHDVVIIGAGISGLAAAILLERMGVKVTIFETKTSVQHIGGGLGIWPNGTEVLYKILGDLLEQLTGKFDTLDFTNAKGKILNKTPLSLFKKIRPFTNMFICRSELQNALLAQLKHTKIIWGMRCKNVTSSAEKATITLQNNEEIECKLLIAADGIYSSIRQQFFPHKLNYTGYIALGGIIPNNKLKDNTNTLTTAHQRLSAVVSVANNRHYHFAVRPIALEKWLEVSKNSTKQIELFKGWSPLVDENLHALAETVADGSEHYFCLPTYDMELLPQFHHQRIVLLGDAAHPIGPILGLGTTSALCDANFLVQSLQQHTLDDALQIYSQNQCQFAKNTAELEAAEKKNITQETEEEFQQRITTLPTLSAEEIWENFIAKLSLC